MKTILIVASCFLSGCTSFSSKVFNPAEQESGYTYIPVDPFSVETQPGVNCFAGKEIRPYLKLPKGLPDNAVRMLVEQFDSKGNVTYGLGKAEGAGTAYRVTMDFVSSDTTNFPVSITRHAMLLDGKSPIDVPFGIKLNSQQFIPGSETYTVEKIKENATTDANAKSAYAQQFNIPIYVGIGLRVTADIVTLSGKANITGIGIIGAEADAANLKGSLIVQTLGVNSKAVTAALPIQSELNRTTAQNAVVAVASIKTLLHADETDISPRVVGLYLPFPGGKALVNAIISELSKAPPPWSRPCELPQTPKVPT